MDLFPLLLPRLHVSDKLSVSYRVNIMDLVSLFVMSEDSKPVSGKIF